MANNHIIIGIGGTGGNVIRNYRQQIIDKFGKIDGLEQLKNIKFLYIDSNKDDLNSPWNYQGKKINLNGDDIQLLSSGKINDILHDYSTRQEWMGTDGDWGGILKEDTSDKAGNQLRRFGRINLISELNNIIEKIAQKKDTLVNDRTDLGTTIHIITGLSGGTGSGSVVDISAKLAKNFENENDVTIVLYLVLPELGIVNDKKGQYNGISFLKKNGYAALKELNSLATGKLEPFDIILKNSRIKTNKRFQAAYIITEKNQTGVSFSEKAKISSIASLLFLKTITTQKEIARKSDGNIDFTTLPGQLNTFDTAENNMIAAETYWGLSDKFRVPGIYKLAIPKVQIRESFAYLLVLNAFNNLLYKNFDEVGGHGYLDQLSTDQNSVTKEKNQILTYLNSALLDEWYLTYDYLILDKPMLDDKVLINEGINDITIKGAYSKEYTRQYKLLKGTKQYNGTFIKENEILKCLQMEINNYFNQKFKGDGFEVYYNNMQKNLVPKADFIANRIKNKILGKESGKYSRNFPLVSYVDLLQSIATEFIDKLTIDLKNKQNEYKKLLANSQKELNNIREEYVSSFGFFSWIFGGGKKREKAIKNFETSLQQFWIYTISLRGIDYAFQLINSHLKNKLLEIKVEVEKDISKVKERRDSLNKEFLEEKRKIEGSDDIEGFKPVSDNKKLEEFQTILLKKKEIFEPLMLQLERYIFDDKENVCNTQKCENKKLLTMKSAYNMIDDILSDRKITDLIGEGDTFYNANIIELLYKKYNGNANDSQLTELLADLNKRSAPMALINSLHKGNIDTKHNKLVILPMIDGVKADNKEILEFYKALKDKITNTIQGSKIKELTGPDIKSEITICQFLFPIRTDAIDNIIELKKDYDKDISASQMLFLVHTEDCSDLVELIPPKQPDEFMNMLLPYIMIISSIENGFEEPYGSNKYWQISGSLSEREEDIITVQLECNKLDSFLMVDFNKLDKLNTKGSIAGFIHPYVFRLIEKRALDIIKVKGNNAIIVKKCEKFIVEYLKQIQNDLLDKTYLRFKSAYQMIIKIINKN